MQSKITSALPLAQPKIGNEHTSTSLPHISSAVAAGENNYLLNGIANNANCVDFLNEVSFMTEPAVDTVGKRMLLSENMRVITKNDSAK
ncbi:MAG TPA: hypothetical protein VF283_11790 [Bryobacteraceae bacterium]